jgi:molecular chaperone DnaJ
MIKDYYQILEVDKNVDEKTLKKKYRQLSKKYHPDVNPNNPEAEDKFKEVAKAYEVLSDKDKKQNYDMFGDENNRGGNPFGGGVDMDNIFNSFFGGHQQRRQRVRKGSDIRINLKLNIDEIFAGVYKKIKYKRNENCVECKSTGGKTILCKQCDGKGHINHIQNTPIGRVQNTIQCHSCNGRGKIIIDPCKVCSGKAYTIKEETLEFNVPPGLSDGENLILREKGNSTPNGINGDLNIQIIELPHEKFKRSGLDIHQRVILSYRELVLGTPKEIDTLDGKIRIKIKEGTEVGHILRVSKKGLRRDGRVGDMMIEIWVEIPKDLNEEEKIKIDGLKN